MTTDSAPLDPEEEANLAAFLSKVSAACNRDSDVPGFVGAQVNEWLAEIAAGNNSGADQANAATGETGGAAGSGEAPTSSSAAEEAKAE